MPELFWVLRRGYLVWQSGAKPSSPALPPCANPSSSLKHAFPGKLVPQDPNDEPAAELLARIRANRAAGPRRVGKARRARAQP